MKASRASPFAWAEGVFMRKLNLRSFIAAVLRISLSVFPGRAWAQSGTVTDDGFRSNNSTTQQANSWSKAASMPTARLDLGAAAVNGKVYAIAGNHSINSPISNTVEVYYPSSDSWSTAASRPGASNGLGAADVGGLIYAIGAFTGAHVVNATEQYAPPVTIYTFMKN
jgi:N-acetylneuraminic acid mutarotase